jgi:hypothetical protein
MKRFFGGAHLLWEWLVEFRGWWGKSLMGVEIGAGDGLEQVCGDESPLDGLGLMELGFLEGFLKEF